MTPLCTAGYEGRTADDLVHLLAAHDIQLVVDVRERPLSRKRGLSKVSLAQRLADVGVEYLHVRELGNPRDYREALKQGWAFGEFAIEFKARLESLAAELEELSDVAVGKKTCLLCFEADPARCHRSLVAEALAATTDGEMEVIHLGHDA